MICQTYTRLSLADEAVKLGGNLDPQKRLLLQDAMAKAVADLRRLRFKYKKRLLSRKFRALHPELHRQRVSDWQKRHTVERRIYGNAYNASHKEARKRQRKESLLRHRETRRNWSKRYRAIKGDKIREYHRKYRPAWRAKQMATNPEFVLKDRMRSCLKRGLTNHNLKKTARTEAMVGCTMAHLKSHIESQFLPGMSWDDPSSYSIDHIVPIDAFNLLDPEELHWSFNWQNLRPFPLQDNKVKHSKISFPLPSWLPPHISERITTRHTSKL